MFAPLATSRPAPARACQLPSFRMKKMPLALLTILGDPNAAVAIRTPPPGKGTHPGPGPSQAHTPPPPPTWLRPISHAWQSAPTPMALPRPGRPTQLVPCGSRSAPVTLLTVPAVVAADSVIADVKTAGRPVRVSDQSGCAVPAAAAIWR